MPALLILATFVPAGVFAQEDSPIVRAIVGRGTAQADLEEALDTVRDWDVSGLTLAEFFERIRKEHRVEVVISPTVEEEGKSLGEKVELKLTQGTLREAVDRALAPQEMEAVAYEGQLIVMGEIGCGIEATYLYDTADLIRPETKERDLATQRDAESLRRLILSTTSGTWEEEDGTGGTIDVLFGGRVTRIRQSEEVHREIQETLTALRLLRGLPPKRWIRVNASGIARFVRESRSAPPLERRDGSPVRTRPVIPSESRVP